MSRWIQLESGFFRHPKTLRLKRAIGSDALWIPARLWCYCSDRERGDVSDLKDEDLKDILEYNGDAAVLVAALKSSGFLSPDGKTVTGWDERYRKKLEFYRERASKGAAARWSRPVVSGGTEDNTEIRQDKIKKHRQASSKDASRMLQASRESASDVALPPPLNTDEFKAAWADWLQHRREIKKPVTPTSGKHTLRNMERMGAECAIAAIRYTISKGWQGLREPDRNTESVQSTQNPATTSTPANLR